MKALPATLLAFLLVTACSRFSKVKETPIQPAADPAIAAATSFSTTLTEIYLDKQGVIASGTIKTNAPLATATAGTYSFNPLRAGAVSYPGESVTARLAEHSGGQIRIHRSGNQAVLVLLSADGQEFLRIIGPPNGNAIRSSWYYEGTASGLVTLQPRRVAP